MSAKMERGREHMLQPFYYLDDGHGDYNRSYERDYDVDYADYSTDHRENNFRNFEEKVPKSKKERVRNILKHYE
jgi:hypothetical protein